MIRHIAGPMLDFHQRCRRCGAVLAHPALTSVVWEPGMGVLVEMHDDGRLSLYAAGQFNFDNLDILSPVDCKPEPPYNDPVSIIGRPVIGQALALLFGRCNWDGETGEPTYDMARAKEWCCSHFETTHDPTTNLREYRWSV